MDDSKVTDSGRCPWCWWVGADPCESMAEAAACSREPSQGRLHLESEVGHERPRAPRER